MLKPLQQFYCDSCGQIINNPSQGYTEWKVETSVVKGFYTSYCKGFKIIHGEMYPQNENKSCSQYLYDPKVYDQHLPLDRMISTGIIKLLPFLNDGSFNNQHKSHSSIKEEDMPDFIEFFSRITIPFYEEARKYFVEAENTLFYRELCGEDVYDAATLERIVKTFSKEL